MDSLEEDEVDFQNIPAPPNPNERIIYFNSPPLKIELGDVSPSAFPLLNNTCDSYLRLAIKLL
jgi:hypothetical protein